ncbi:MAG: 3',5'-cyclic-nucleotide phosphodiesterase [Gammaproteobacteria bacterium]|nr:3',5'-cyclic-nucleotide phosphodiesterase [Gammaproteobacteria bacterium]
MKLRVLGCTGGIGPGMRTTALMIDNDVLIDCGSGVGDLTQDEQNGIRHIFLTHAHLDHIAFIPFLADSAFEALVGNPITIHLQPETLEILQKHIFNWQVWPDFTRLPNEKNPVIQYNVINPGQQVKLGNRLIEAIPVTHTQAAVGYRVQSSEGGSFAFSGDTKSTDQFWATLNNHSSLDLLIIECAYTDHEEVLSQIAGHHRPSSLAEDLRKLQHNPDLYITHHKPGEEGQIMRQLAGLVEGRTPKVLKRGQIFEL